jgi:hypothetical protein
MGLEAGDMLRLLVVVKWSERDIGKLALRTPAWPGQVFGTGWLVQDDGTDQELRASAAAVIAHRWGYAAWI